LCPDCGRGKSFQRHSRCPKPPVHPQRVRAAPSTNKGLGRGEPSRRHSQRQTRSDDLREISGPRLSIDEKKLFRRPSHGLTWAAVHARLSATGRTTGGHLTSSGLWPSARTGVRQPPRSRVARRRYLDWQPADEKGRRRRNLLPALRKRRDRKAGKTRPLRDKEDPARPAAATNEGTLIEAMQNAWAVSFDKRGSYGKRFEGGQGQSATPGRNPRARSSGGLKEAGFFWLRRAKKHRPHRGRAYPLFRGFSTRADSGTGRPGL